MQLRDVVEFLAQLVGTEPFVVLVATYVPELPKVAAALIGRIFAPQKLARELVVEADHVALDELLVGLEQAYAVVRDEADVRQEQLVADVGERPVHRQVD